MSLKFGGLTKNFSSRGTRTTVSLRGTGLSYVSSSPRRIASQPVTGCFGRLFGGVVLFFFGGIVIIAIAIALAPQPQSPVSDKAPAIRESAPTVQSPVPQNATVSPPEDTAPSAPSPQPPVSAPATLTDNADYHGTTETNFAKDWVVVDGTKITGIFSVSPAPDAQVAILYSDGGRDVPVNKLPQGFLDSWSITPEKLQTANAPP
jgi:hypothetical protein